MDKITSSGFLFRAKSMTISADYSPKDEMQLNKYQGGEWISKYGKDKASDMVTGQLNGIAKILKDADCANIKIGKVFKGSSKQNMLVVEFRSSDKQLNGSVMPMAVGPSASNVIYRVDLKLAGTNLRMVFGTTGTKLKALVKNLSSGVPERTAQKSEKQEFMNELSKNYGISNEKFHEFIKNNPW